MGFVGSNFRKEERQLEKNPDVSIKQSNPRCGETISQSKNNIKQFLMTAPCPCSNTSPHYEPLDTTNNCNSNMTNNFVGPYQNYDVPRTAMQQVLITINWMLE